MSQTIMEDTAALLNGRYQILDCIGTGGMASVYRAADVLLGRSVAIKMLRPELEGAAVRSARSETAVLASLSHPNLVTLFDAHLAPHSPEYLVMELVDGPTLGTYLCRGPLTTTEAAHLATELADALHVVHEAGIVHRDMKPSNVLLAPTSTPGRTFRAKLADFGVAFLLGQAHVTMPGIVVGTLGYLAPEQLRGEAPTPASDIYALGLVLLEALTAQRVFPSHGSAEAPTTRRTDPIEIPDHLPDEWADLLRRMTAGDPGARPRALDVAREAQRLAALPTVVVEPTRPLPAPTTAVLPVTAPAAEDARAARSDRRRRAAALLVGAAAVGAIVTGLWAGAAADSPAVARPAPADAPPATRQQPAELAPYSTAPEDPAAQPVEGNGQPPADDEQKAAEERLKEEQKAAEEARKQGAGKGKKGG